MAGDLYGSSEESTPCLLSGGAAGGMAQGAERAGAGGERRARLVALDVLVMLFGLGAWVGVNGTYVQLPQLVAQLPEGWHLPSFMTVVIQIANIGPLTYALLRRIAPQIPDAVYVYIVLTIGTVAMTLTSFLYTVTTTIGGEERSTVFLILLFFTALVGCTSSVLFYPFMRHYRDIYLITYLVGEGLSGFLPSVLALIQGVGGNPECIPGENSTLISFYPEPRFETTYFLLTIAVLLGISLLSFVILSTSKRFDSEKVEKLIEGDEKKDEVQQVPSSKSLLSARHLSLLLLMLVVNAFGNGVFPSIQTYSCLPYGNVTFHLAITLSSMANPLACFLAVFLPRTSSRALAALSAAAALFSAYILATALLSPAPPLLGHVSGDILVVGSWVAAVALVSYVKLCVASVFRAHSARGMFCCGAAAQAGSALGSLLLFLLVNFTRIFTASNPCQ